MGTATAPRETDRQTHSNTAAADVELIDRDRWEREVVGVATDVIEWGTHSFPVEVQLFDDGSAHMRVAAPSDPPPCAAEIVADLRRDGAGSRSAAAILAREWGVAADWVADRRGGR